jgi:hypothetical protein
MDIITVDVEQGVLECPICFETIKTCVSLPCSHTFCKECLETYFTKLLIDNQTVTCPCCRADILLNTSMIFIAIREVLLQQTSQQHTTNTNINTNINTNTTAPIQNNTEIRRDQEAIRDSNYLQRSLIYISGFSLIIAFSIALAVIIDMNQGKN